MRKMLLLLVFISLTSLFLSGCSSYPGPRGYSSDAERGADDAKLQAAQPQTPKNEKPAWKKVLGGFLTGLGGTAKGVSQGLSQAATNQQTYRQQPSVSCVGTRVGNSVYTNCQ